MRPVRRQLFGRDVRQIHCLGVGGMGVGPLAMYLAQLGYAVSGEDDALGSEMRAHLERAGVSLRPIGDDCDLVACSSAIPESHPVRLAAATRKVPIVRRGELLAEVIRDRKLVAVCGSHGKTTTTAMLATALRRSRCDAGYLLGGLFADGSAPAAVGSNEWVVAEIDESDGTIDAFAPEITVAVNLDWDHPDQYRRVEDIEAAFARLFSRTRRAVLVSADCPMSARVRRDTSAKVLTFGRGGDFASELVGEQADWLSLRLAGRFEPREISVKARGAFNAANATAALAAAALMEVAAVPEALTDYPSVRRRQTVLHTGGPVVVEDYAHHPAEIRALLGSLRQRVHAPGRLIVVFQPHRFSRTAQFAGDFAAALADADELLLLDVYSAGESPVAGGTTEAIVAAANRAGRAPVRHCPGADSTLFSALDAVAGPADLVAFVGAGDIDRKGRAWLAGRQTRWDDFVTAVRPLLAPATKCVREEPLAGKTTMRVGGAARVYAEPTSVADVQRLLREAAARAVPVFVLGRGSNLVVPDEGVDGLVLSLANEAWASFEPRPDGRVWVGAGLRLKNLCGLAAKAGLVGFEFLEGIPGSVGGALRMNAGAMGGWMFDVVEEVQLITLAGEVRTLPKAAMHVDYRHCAELHDAIALGALLRPASQADGAAIRRQMDAYAKKRHESQPREPSAGCVFKNPPGTSAGRLIDECGLKGTRVGDAEVSPVHANFIVNRGHATSADVLELVRRIRARVHDAKGINLHPEVLLYGKKWEEVL